MQACFVSVLLKPGVQVACNAVVRACVGTVGRYVHFDNEIALEVVVFGCGHAHLRVSRQYDNAAVVVAHAYLVFRTYHSVAVNAAQARFLYHEFLVAVVQLATQGGHNYFLAGCNVGRAAYYLRRFAAADVYGAYVHVVAVGVRLARQHFAYYESGQSALYCLYFFNRADFQAYRGQRVGCFLRGKIEINILLEPLI